MKTRERIIQTSLLLFNEESESHVTTVDIANEMDISPGNLYYHFKGKDQIIDELFGRYESTMTDILKGPMEKPLKLEDNWFYLYVVFEEIFNYRFLYYNLTDIMHRYASLNKRFQRLLKLKFSSIKVMCEALRDQGVLEIDDDEIESLANSLVLTITYWVNYSYLQGGEKQDVVVIHKGVHQIMTLIAPYFTKSAQTFYNESKDTYKKMLADAENPEKKNLSKTEEKSEAKSFWKMPFKEMAI